MTTCPMPGWRFNKSVIAKSNNMINLSERHDIEYGALFCGDIRNKKINLEKTCKGDHCEVDIPSRCPKPYTILGIFHTHPHRHPESSAEPSAVDLAIHYGRRYLVDCIGYPGSKEEKRKRRIICYVDKPNIKDKEKDLLSENSKLKNLIDQLDLEESGLLLTTGTETTRKELEKYYTKFKPEDCI